MGAEWESGNALTLGETQRGWLIGHFLPEGQLRHSDEVELKWASHQKGDIRAEWVTGETRTTLLVLISGTFQVSFRDGVQVLHKCGDFAMWGPGVDHSWEALDSSTMLTVRWPSRPT